MMEIKDRIYGEENISENILIELINSDSVQRLKGIDQWFPRKYYHKKNGFSRYEHSLGVFILLRKLGASLNEQIAGLLHDVSHTAFSHVVDWAIGDPTKEDHQDNIYEEVIKDSEIPGILNKRGVDLGSISKLENFTLLEREAPALCADRVDYSLRELASDNGAGFAEKFFKKFVVKNGELVFQDETTAESFAREYLKMQKIHWAGNQARMRYYLLANVLKRGFETKIISYSDLKKTDDFVLGILENCEDDYITDNLHLLRQGFDIIEDPEGIVLKKKFRYVDPGVAVNGFVKKLSELSSGYANILELEKENSKIFKRVKMIENEN